MPHVVDDYLEKTLKEQYDPKGEYGIKTLAFFLQAAEQWAKTNDEHLKLYGENLLALAKT